MPSQQVIVAITGASGARYALRLIEQLLARDCLLHVLVSDAARVVLKQECDVDLPQEPEAAAAALASLSGHANASVRCYAKDDWFAPVASGSAGIRKMVIVPCSMGSLARIANGISENLLERAADVMLKERGQLILVPRETPLSAIHLEHMLKLSRLGVETIPAMPGFYHRPQTIDELVDFVVDRVLDHLDMSHEEVKRWGD